jgi:CHAT domain-containing protein
MFVVSQQEVHVLPAIASPHIVTRLLNRWRFNLQSVRLALLSVRRSSPDRGAGLRSEISPNQAHTVRRSSPDLGVRLADEAHDILRALYHHLIAPVAPYLENQTALWIVPHDTLWEVPFAALHDGSQYLIERFTLMNMPGLLPYEAAGGQPHSPAAIATAPVVAGYSDGGRLTYALHEAKTVAALWDKATVLLEEDTTLADLQDAASVCTLLHLATHGVFRQDAPLFSALHLSDGALTAYDLEAWRMPAVELVTLSACETGMHLSWGSDLLGLARGFWRAGAPRLLVSLWAVDDASTADLMVHVYTALQAEAPVAAALQAAQTNALVKYRHPFYWAGFTLLELAV